MTRDLQAISKNNATCLKKPRPQDSCLGFLEFSDTLSEILPDSILGLYFDTVLCWMLSGSCTVTQGLASGFCCIRAGQERAGPWGGAAGPMPPPNSKASLNCAPSVLDRWAPSAGHLHRGPELRSDKSSEHRKPGSFRERHVQVRFLETSQLPRVTRKVISVVGGQSRDKVSSEVKATRRHPRSSCPSTLGCSKSGSNGVPSLGQVLPGWVQKYHEVFLLTSNMEVRLWKHISVTCLR